MQFTNTGVVSGLGQSLVSNASVSEVITNTGSMTGDVCTSDLVGGDLNNAGEIVGNVYTRGGGDLVGNTGTISGSVIPEAGNDLFVNSGAGTVVGVFEGGTGNHTIIGGGGVGNDEITAEAGKDVMRGNRGEDVFIFTDALDSTTSAVDRIRDFQSGQDLIDMSAIATFDFIGSAAVSGTGIELRFQTTTTGLRFEAGVDGDGSADMRVNMNNISVVTSEDFILGGPHRARHRYLHRIIRLYHPIRPVRDVTFYTAGSALSHRPASEYRQGQTSQTRTADDFIL